MSEDPVAFAFFDNEVSLEDKRRMVQVFDENPDPDPETTMFRLIIPPSRMKYIEEWQLDDFITENTRNFFTRFNISTDFFEIDPSEWHANEEYKRAQKFLEKLQVTNDHVERGIGLIKRFNRKLTKNEDEVQCLLQTIAKNEREDEGITKSALKRT